MRRGTLSTKFFATTLPELGQQRRPDPVAPTLQKLRAAVDDLKKESSAYARYLRYSKEIIKTLPENLKPMTDSRVLDVLERQYQRLSVIDIRFERFDNVLTIIDGMAPFAPLAARECRSSVRQWRKDLLDLADECDKMLAWQKDLISDEDGKAPKHFMNQSEKFLRVLSRKNEQVAFANIHFEIKMIALKDSLASQRKYMRCNV